MSFSDSLPLATQTESNKLYFAGFTNDEVLLDTEEQVRDVYGDWFCNKIGLQYLMQMPRVSASTLNLQFPNKYPQRTVLLGHLQNASAVKGLDGWNRPFIAIKIEQYDNTAHKCYKYVELLFKRYSIEDRCGGKKGDIHQNNYVSALSNMCDDGISRESMIYQTGGTYDWSHLEELMEGKFVRTSLMRSKEGFIRKI